ncbi:MAG: MFS transporter, partial [Pseudomonadales bacterium]
RGMARDFFGTFRNINFRNLLYYDLAASSSYGITVTLNVMAWTYYWELDATQMALLMGLPVITAVPLALLTLGPLGKRWPKHKILNRAIIFMLLDAIWLYLLRIFDVIPENGHPVVLGLLLLQNFLFVYLFVLRNVASYSITADLTDEHESNSGKRQEGGFYSALAFTTKLASAAGPLYAGVALDLIGLSEGMMPGQINQAVLGNLVWVLAIGVIPLMLIAWYFTFRVSMSEEQLLEIQQNISARSAQAIV